MLTIGTKVQWTTKSNDGGRGVVLTDEENGMVLVRVNEWTDTGGELEVHPVISCAVTWLNPY